MTSDEDVCKYRNRVMHERRKGIYGYEFSGFLRMPYY